MHNKDSSSNDIWDIFLTDFEQRSTDQLNDLREKQKDISLIFKDCFSTPSGQKVLKYFTENTLDIPVTNPHAPNVGEVASYREGQNSIIREIKTRLKFVQGDSDE